MTFAKPVEYYSDVPPFESDLADLDGDEDLDVASARWNGHDGGLLLENDGSGVLTKIGTTGTGNNDNVVAADMDDDGLMDLVVTGRPGRPVMVLPGNGDFTFGNRLKVRMADNQGGLAVGDVNGDGVLDLLTGTYDEPVVSVRLGRGGGKFGALVQYPVDTEAWGLQVADLDLDGRDDVVLQPTAADIAVMRAVTDGALRAPVRFPAGGQVGQVVVGDFDGDGAPDLVTGIASLESVSFLRNKAGDAS